MKSNKATILSTLTAILLINSGMIFPASGAITIVTETEQETVVSLADASIDTDLVHGPSVNKESDNPASPSSASETSASDEEAQGTNDGAEAEDSEEAEGAEDSDKTKAQESDHEASGEKELGAEDQKSLSDHIVEIKVEEAANALINDLAKQDQTNPEEEAQKLKALEKVLEAKDELAHEGCSTRSKKRAAQLLASASNKLQSITKEDVKNAGYSIGRTTGKATLCVAKTALLSAAMVTAAAGGLAYSVLRTGYKAAWIMAPIVKEEVSRFTKTTYEVTGADSVFPDKISAYMKSKKLIPNNLQIINNLY